MIRFISRIQIPAFEEKHRQYYEKTGVNNLLEGIQTSFPFEKISGDFVLMKDYNGSIPPVEYELDFLGVNKKDCLKFKSEILSLFTQLGQANAEQLKKIHSIFNEFESEKPAPDYKGFGEHILEWDEKGIPYGNSDLLRLADKYNTPKPIIKDGKIEFEK